MNNPIYFNCFFTDDQAEDTVCTYKIILSESVQYPFELYKLINIVSDQWEHSSSHALLMDAIKLLTCELFSREVRDAIHHDQALLNIDDILAKIYQGKMSISIGAINHREFLTPRFDVVLDELLQMDKPALK
jgi:hypothetical protein